ncbi:unnamed protein product [Allacma fusca]|uniref:STAS domain-containing protein n=1 Tax=Allacma fusca TaxID=39272 RepID=A0A8J2JYD8_9HEXA|nr:unnamed protein product [Allacma fusca]
MSRKFLRDRALSVTKSEAEEQEQIRLVESPEPELEPTMASFLNDDSDHFYTTGAEKQRKIIIDRPVLTQAYICSKYSSSNDLKTWNPSSCKEWFKTHKCNPKKTIFSLIPILTWLPSYEWRSISFDLVAGFVVAVLNIPQGMAYAMLGNLPAIVGIYMAFFPVIIYAILGTSRHVSMGTFAVICLMSGKAALDYQSSHHSPSKPDYSILEITTAITFCVGIWQAILGVLRLGAASLLLNSELVSGFTTGAAVHVLTSQVKSLLGLSIPKRTGIFKIILSYIDFGKNIQNSNVAAVVISVITISVLTVYNEFLKPYWTKKIPFPLPIELITIIIGTVVSLYFNFHELFNIAIVDHIPTGLPAPELPNFEIVKEMMFPQGLLICIVAYAISVSMAKIFAGKHNYSVDANQELLAQGGSNLVGSFFSCGPVSVSLSRSVIQEQVGGRTQLASLFSCAILIFVLLWIGPFFETLPNCVLSSIIVVALKGMFLQVKDFRSAWKLSKVNGFIWLCTFMSTVVLDIEYGLAIGVALSVLTLLWRSNRPKMTLLGVYENTELYVDINSSEQVKELPHVKIIKYTGCLNFATAESFSNQILKLVPLTKEQPKKGKLSIPKLIPTISTISKEKITDNVSIGTRETNVSVEEKIQWIILDMSSMSSLDPEAARALNALIQKYANEIVQVMITGCADPVLDVMKTCGVLSQVGIRHVFPTVHDAVVSCGLQIENQSCPTQSNLTNYDYPINYESESDNEVAYQELESSVRRHNVDSPGVR